MKNTLYASNPAIYTVELRNPDTNGAFYITRHMLSASTNLDTFELTVDTSVGSCEINICELSSLEYGV